MSEDVLRRSPVANTGDFIRAEFGVASADSSSDTTEIDWALGELRERGQEPSDGKWLEELAVRVAPLIREWDVAKCWSWEDWPDRERLMPGAPRRDLGIDLVAHRRSDGGRIAIQAKSRQLDDEGTGNPITAREADKFLAASAADLWAERWFVVNGAVGLGGNALAKAKMQGGVTPRVVNVHADLVSQQAAMTGDAVCDHCARPDHADATQSRTCMQNEAVSQSVRRLDEHCRSDSGGTPFGEARGRIILPCGTGKTRIALRVVEALTMPRQVSVVLCPSIALVAQIRREFLQHADRPLRALAVCSDETAGYNPRREGSTSRVQDPTMDNSNVSAEELKGSVTTDPQAIARWMAGANSPKGANALSVVFGTYQSADRIAEALADPATPELAVLICDEAHRTAGLRRRKKPDEKQRVKTFVLCHDSERFPARYRVYQTATPRIYTTTNSGRANNRSDLVVRSMDDESVFGVELYRKSYQDAVANGWLSDYRIIALAVNDPGAYALANELARGAETDGNKKLSSMDFLRGLAFALAMAGATRIHDATDDVRLSSAIGFLNTVKKSQAMAKYLQTGKVLEWLREQIGAEHPPAFKLAHLDATHNVAARDSAKQKLADASPQHPFGIVNVGIFGEGTDAPTLSAVAFLEPRKSPIDVVQAVGRAMRTAPGKQLGYIVVPIVIPLNQEPETWLSHANPDEGWSELGQILLALRAHDRRIEEELGDLLTIYTPSQEQLELRTTTFVAIAAPGKRIAYGLHTGTSEEAEQAAKEAAVSGMPPSRLDITRIRADEWTVETEPMRIVTAKVHQDGTVDLRHDSVKRDTKRRPTGGPGPVNPEKTKKHARSMINAGAGKPLPPRGKRRKPTTRRTAQERDEAQARRLFDQLGDLSEGITVNLLSRSGLTRDRVERDLNILQESVAEAAHHLREDSLQAALDGHFGLDNLDVTRRGRQADGCVIGSLLMMNSAMLHQRIAAGGWDRNIEPLADIKNDPQVIDAIERNWERITRRDFLPVIEPAREVIYAIKETGRLAGLERCLRHLSAEAERIAETYADMGADHAGPLFNKVMGNQASDGAYFTRPPAATIAARLALDAADTGSLDWTDPRTWRAHRTVDLACGSGTLLAAMLTDMKRRAREQGATDDQLAALQKLAVEGVLKGMDINPVSLQLAATQLTAGNRDIKYNRMGLFQMPYGPTGDPSVPVAAGTLELLAEEAVLPNTQMFPDAAKGSALRVSLGDPVIEQAAEAALDARIVLMNPPFTNRAKAGEKFPKPTQTLLRSRVDGMEDVLVSADPGMAGFIDTNSLAPLFVALADRCLGAEAGVLAMIHPTIALTNPSGRHERRVLTDRYHIHTILTCHEPGQTNLSQHTNINESIVILRRRADTPPPATRIVNLDRFPTDDTEAAQLFAAINEDGIGTLAGGWGQVSEWPAHRIEKGDWTAAIWRSPTVAEAAAEYAEHPDLQPLATAGLSGHATGQQLRGGYRRSTAGDLNAFPILKSKGADAQQNIESTPDEHWVWDKPGDPPILSKKGHLLVTAGQDTATGRLTAVASDDAYVGNGWMPVTGVNVQQARAAAVYINSTVGRLLLMRNPGRKLNFPSYSADAANRLPIPNLEDPRIVNTLAACWRQTRHMTVPQYRDGECEVRRLWDAAVCAALGWDPEPITRLRLLLHEEPHVKSLGYGQYADAPDDI